MEQPVLVVGPGAVGLALAAGLRAGDERVALLGSTSASERRLAQSGFVVKTPDGRATAVRDGLISARTLKGPARVAFFCVKSIHVASAARAVRRWIGPETVVVALQNGLGHETIFRRAFGPRRVVVGACYFAVDRPSPDEVRRNGGNDIFLARRPGNEAAFATAQALLTRAGFRVHARKDEAEILWTKACLNAALNPIGALCAADNGTVVTDPTLRAAALQALAEAVAAARAAGHPIDYDATAAKLLRVGHDRQRNSMLQDLAAGRRTEVEAIVGPLIAAGRRHSVKTPTLELLAAAVVRLERTLVGKRSN